MSTCAQSICIANKTYLLIWSCSFFIARSVLGRSVYVCTCMQCTIPTLQSTYILRKSFKSQPERARLMCTYCQNIVYIFFDLLCILGFFQLLLVIIKNLCKIQGIFKGLPWAEGLLKRPWKNLTLSLRFFSSTTTQ